MLKYLFVFALIGWTWTLDVFHLGVLTPPPITRTEGKGTWYPRAEHGLNHLVLEGSPYGRGRESGKLTRDIMKRQEDVLTAKLFSMIPPALFRVLEVPLIRWFAGAEDYVSTDLLAEMYGTSKSAAPEYDWLIDGYTRQFAYHGLHEVGQMMVDSGAGDRGCTFVGVPTPQGWVVGRNFDFEGGRILDEEKIVKWVFPDDGNAFVSIIWAGMVGVVTGVNEYGVYVSINAGGSSDRRRFGTPSTLVVLEALRTAKNAAEAVQIIENSTMFITDIFLVLGPDGLMKIEKTPLRSTVTPLTSPSVVANHLESAPFVDDPVNRQRRENLTTLARASRGREMLAQIPAGARGAERRVLEILRDKGIDPDGHPLALGNRSAIDALIATHSVIFNAADNTLFVGQGPAVAGEFLGYDLTKSFKERRPVLARTLPADPQVSRATYERVKADETEVKNAHAELERGACPQITATDTAMAEEFLGDRASKCDHDLDKARASWTRALALAPAYREDRERLERKIKENP